MRETDNSVKMLKVNDDIGVSQASFRRCVRVYASHQKSEHGSLQKLCFGFRPLPERQNETGIVSYFTPMIR